MNLRELHLTQNASLAEDGIPLHYSDLRVEYHTALENTVLMDRSHEARIEVTGKDRFNLIHRISTNDLQNMQPGEGRATIFTNANARILDRIFIFNRGERALMITEPGRGTSVMNYLQRNIFFNDDFRLNDLSVTTHLWTIHGPRADDVMQAWIPGITSLQNYSGGDFDINGIAVFAARRKPISESHWVVIVPIEHAVMLWTSLQQAGEAFRLIPAGSLTYNTLRIRAGRPGIGRELSQEYIPLEAGLWDEVSFSKGCYTGQEIIARMESRNRLAKIMVKLQLDAGAEAPAELYFEGRKSGVLTSSVTTPDGDHVAIGFVKVSDAQPEAVFTVGDHNIKAAVTGFAGQPPPQLAGEAAASEVIQR